MKFFEYNTVISTPIFATELNKYGDDGWELVSFSPWEISQFSNSPVKYMYIFKREKN